MFTAFVQDTCRKVHRPRARGGKGGGGKMRRMAHEKIPSDRKLVNM